MNSASVAGADVDTRHWIGGRRVPSDGTFTDLSPIDEKPLAAHPDLARVCFTGSVATGRLVAAAAGAQLTPASLELGGKSPFLVFADAGLDLAVRHAVGQYDNAGQVCLAGTRLPVEESVAAEFLARFTERAGALRQGDPRDESTDVGPNITRQHLERVDGFVRRGRAVGHRPRGRHLELRLLRRREERRATWSRSRWTGSAG